MLWIEVMMARPRLPRTTDAQLNAFRKAGSRGRSSRQSNATETDFFERHDTMIIFFFFTIVLISCQPRRA